MYLVKSISCVSWAYSIGSLATCFGDPFTSKNSEYGHVYTFAKEDSMTPHCSFKFHPDAFK